MAPDSRRPGNPSPDAPLILLAEDDDGARMVFEQILVFRGYRVEGVTTAASAVERLQRPEPVALVITDLGLPDGSGTLVVEAARTRAPSPPVILTSGRPLESLRPETRALAGNTRFLKKPFTAKGLTAAVGEMLGPPRPEGDRDDGA